MVFLHSIKPNTTMKVTISLKLAISGKYGTLIL